MKNWNDLTNKEKAELQVEFDMEYKFKIPNFKYGLYIISFISFFFAIGFSLSSSQGKGLDNSYTTYVKSTLGGIFIITFLITLILAIINSVLIDKRKKKFEKWLLTKNIIKI